MDCLTAEVCTMPNIQVLLQLFATLSLSTCSCEHSASALRRLNTYLRCTQSEDSLAAATVIHTNYSMLVDVNHVCRLWAVKDRVQGDWSDAHKMDMEATWNKL